MKVAVQVKPSGNSEKLPFHGPLTPGMQNMSVCMWVHFIPESKAIFTFSKVMTKTACAPLLSFRMFFILFFWKVRPTCYIDVVNVHNVGVELEAQTLGLLDRVGQLALDSFIAPVFEKVKLLGNHGLQDVGDDVVLTVLQELVLIDGRVYFYTQDLCEQLFTCLSLRIGPPSSL